MLDMVRRNAWKLLVPALGVCVTAYFANYFVNGPKGIVAWTSLNAEVKEARERLERLKVEADRLENRVGLKRPDALDPDLLDETARRALGLAHPDEIIVRR
jgi:cell division protein FtsB